MIARACIDAGFFLGAWRFERVIAFLDHDRQGRVVGDARLAELGDGRLDYYEVGQFHYDGAPTVSWQRYTWRFLGDGRLDILNRDGASLCEIDLGAAAPSAVHHCGADRYALSMSVTPPVWKQIWRVTGPRKNYRSETEFRR